MKTYRVDAEHPILDHAPGSTFEADLPEDQERFFVLRGNLAIITDRRPKRPQTEQRRGERS